MRALIIGPDETAAIRKAVAYAERPEHWYQPGVTRVVPGNNPRFVTRVPHGFRCVFTFTKHNGSLYRHLTVSVNGPLLPSPEACVMLAKEYGFTASDDSFDFTARMKNDGWMVSRGHAGENCIALIQPVEDARRQVYT